MQIQSSSLIKVSFICRNIIRRPTKFRSFAEIVSGIKNIIMQNEKSSFDHMWDLLNPPREFHNMRAKCETSLWNTFSIHMQHRVYRLIRDRKRRGETINPNPWYALVNARDAEPTNYNGDARIDDLSKTTKMVVAWYKSRAGIYTLEEALALKLSIIREFKPLND